MKDFFQKFNIVFSKKEKIYFLFYLIFTLLVPILEVLSLGSIVGLIYFILEPDKFLFFLNNFNFKFSFNSENNDLSVLIVFTIALAFLFKNLILVFYGYVESKFRNRLVAKKSTKLFKTYISLNYINFKEYKKSELFNSIILEVARVIDFFFSMLIIFREVFMIALLVISLLFFNVFYTLLLLLFLLGFSLILFLILKKNYLIQEKNLSYFKKD